MAKITFFNLNIISRRPVLVSFVWYAVLAETRNGLKVSFECRARRCYFIEAPNGNQILIERYFEQIGFKRAVKTDAFLRPFH